MSAIFRRFFLAKTGVRGREDRKGRPLSPGSAPKANRFRLGFPSGLPLRVSSASSAGHPSERRKLEVERGRKRFTRRGKCFIKPYFGSFVAAGKSCLAALAWSNEQNSLSHTQAAETAMELGRHSGEAIFHAAFLPDTS